MGIDASELHVLTAAEAVAAFRTGNLTPSALMRACLARIEACDETYNAVMEVMAADALAAAADADEAYARADDRGGGGGRGGRAVPPLRGVPLLVKEQHDLAGRSATRGSRALAGRVAAADHPIVARLRAAGAIPLARTTTPEMSCATFTQTEAWGITRNPFAPDRSPGGSSGGSAAGVALGYAPLATASDIAGSTRLPAAFCGLPGFKTPYGRTPGAPPLNQDSYRGDHVLARTVADTALATGLIAGRSPADHTTVPAPHPYPGLPKHTDLARTTDLAGVRIGVSPDLGCYDVDPEVAAGLETVAAALAGAGAELVEFDLQLQLADITAASMAHYGHFFAANMLRMCQGRTELLEPYTRRFLTLTTDWAKRIPLLESLALDHRIQSQIAEAMAPIDAMVTPTSAAASLPVDEYFLDGLDGCEFYWQRHMTVPFNIANRLPVMAMPSGFAWGAHGGSAHGVPTSVQIVGHPYDDATVFRIAAALEALLPG